MLLKIVIAIVVLAAALPAAALTWALLNPKVSGVFLLPPPEPIEGRTPGFTGIEQEHDAVERVARRRLREACGPEFDEIQDALRWMMIVGRPQLMSFADHHVEFSVRTFADLPGRRRLVQVLTGGVYCDDDSRARAWDERERP
ncbi:MAG: hypothetical protein AAGI51_18795 [Pseudomonadota bacterium]